MQARSVVQTIRIDTGYYYKFWQRRVKEGNATQVMTLLEDIQRIYLDYASVREYPSGFENDTIKKLLQLDVELQQYSTIPPKNL